MIQVGVTEEQKTLLLRGLRFVRSSVKLGMSVPSEEADAQRAADLREVEELIARLDMAESMTAAEC